ncbi:MAG: hypothetical protein ACTSR0_03920 [Candidatus Asgardarchaeia archaeon]
MWCRYTYVNTTGIIYETVFLNKNFEVISPTYKMRNSLGERGLDVYWFDDDFTGYMVLHRLSTSGIEHAYVYKVRVVGDDLLRETPNEEEIEEVYKALSDMYEWAILIAVEYKIPPKMEKEHKSGYKPREQTLIAFRKALDLIRSGVKVKDAVEKAGISLPTFYKLKKEYGKEYEEAVNYAKQIDELIKNKK